MFIIMMNYVESVEMIEKHLVAHRKFLDQCFQNNSMIVAGPRVPRDGGVIISQLSERNELEQVLQQDPFVINRLVQYDIVEFTPTKYHQGFGQFIEESGA